MTISTEPSGKKSPSIGDLMSRRIETIALSESAHNAAKKMRDKRVSSLLVMDTSNSPASPLGILTERDFVRRVCADALNSKNVSIKQILSYPLVTVDPISSIEVAANVMLANKVRHLLVVDSMRNPVGMLTPSDFTKYLSSLVDLDQVSATILKALMEEEDKPGFA